MISVILLYMLKKTIKGFDMFAASPLLRVKGESETTNLFGGICSVLVSILFVYIFISTLIDVLSLKQIEGNETVSYVDRNEDNPLSGFMMAIGIENIDIVASQGIFVAKGYYIDAEMPSRIDYHQFQMVPCSKEMWSDLENLNEDFEKFYLAQMYCPSEDLSVFGNLMDVFVGFIMIEISECNNVTSAMPCAPQPAIDAFFSSVFSQTQYLFGRVFVLSTQFNLNEEKGSFKHINTKGFRIPFSLTKSQQALFQMGTYELETDVSFTPFADKKKEQGIFLDEYSQISYDRSSNDWFLQAYFTASTTHKQMERQFGKIDDVLSYVGGLFGIIMSFFAFFLMSMNEYRYELAVSQGAFKSELEDRTKLTEEHMNLLKYAKYTFYDWVKTLCCDHQLEWKDCNTIDQVREEAIAQIDVQFLLRRINYLQHANRLHISEEEEETMYLSQALSLDKVKKKRMIIEYSKMIMGDRAGLTIDSLQLIERTFNKLGGTNKQGSSSFIFEAFKTNHNQSFEREMIDANELKGKKSKMILTAEEEENQYSFTIIERYLEDQAQYLEEFEKGIPELSEEYVQIEKNVSENFTKISETVRKKVMKKIPLPILNRIMVNKRYSSAKRKQEQSLQRFAQIIKVNPKKTAKNES